MNSKQQNLPHDNNSSIPSSNVHTAQIDHTLLSDIGGKIKIAQKKVISIKRVCEIQQEDHNFVICQTSCSSDSGQFKGQEKLNIWNEIAQNNQLYAQTGARFSPLWCESDKQDDQFLICKQKDHISEISGIATTNIKKIHKLDYMSTIRIKTLLSREFINLCRYHLLSGMLKRLHPSLSQKQFNDRYLELRISYGMPNCFGIKHSQDPSKQSMYRLTNQKFTNISVEKREDSEVNFAVFYL